MTQKLTLSALFIISTSLLAGCQNFKPLDPSYDENEPRGPGLFTGEKGYYEINLD